MIRRGGATLPELIVVAWLFALVLLSLARFASAQGRLAAVSHDRVRAADLVRTIDLVLVGELRYAGVGDWRLARDSIRLRAVRGAGTVCRRTGSELAVRYHGVRRPDPTKDSVLVVTGGSTAGRAFPLVGAAADSACGGYRLTLDRDPGVAAGLALVFETGSYHLTGGALRYRRGRGGRQPVTEAILDDGWFEAGPDGVSARLLLHPDSSRRLERRAWTAFVRTLNGAGP